MIYLVACNCFWPCNWSSMYNVNRLVRVCTYFFFIWFISYLPYTSNSLSLVLSSQMYIISIKRNEFAVNCVIHPPLFVYMQSYNIHHKMHLEYITLLAVLKQALEMESRAFTSYTNAIKLIKLMKTTLFILVSKVNKKNLSLSFGFARTICVQHRWQIEKYPEKPANTEMHMREVI